MLATKTTPKAEETRQRILDSALDLFREEGFDNATMRDISARAGVATGAAYYYYPSKEAIVTAFYARACEEMQPRVEAALEGVRGLEARIRALIQVKFDYFAPHRPVMRALLRNADPKDPLSPFSPQTAGMRDIDIEWFRRILTDCGIGVPRDLAPHMPGVLWMFQMGIIFFWVTDESPQSARTMRLLELGAKVVTTLLRLSALPLMRPARKVALELIHVVKGE
jgi:AcrR family transcriptional regulator